MRQHLPSATFTFVCHIHVFDFPKNSGLFCAQMPSLEFRLSWQAGIWFGTAGFATGMCVLVAGRDKTLAEAIQWAIIPSLACLLPTMILWRLVIPPMRHIPAFGGAVVGAAVGVISHPLGYYLYTLYDSFSSGSPENLTPFAVVTVIPYCLYASFYTLVFWGWLTVISGIILGALVGKKQSRAWKQDLLLSQELKKAPPAQEPAAPSEPLRISLVCPFCKAPFGKDKIVHCSVCGTRHHAACWKQHGHCSLYNCPGKEEFVVSRQKSAVAATAAAIVIVGGLYFFFASRPIHEVPHPAPSAPIPRSAAAPAVLPVAPCGENVELLEAARYGQTQRLTDLIRSGSNVNGNGRVSVFHENDRCWTPLMVSAYYGNKAELNLLIQSDARTNDADEYGDTVLMLAVFGNHPDVVKMLLKAGATASAANKSGDTCLTLASIRGNAQILFSLISSGADPNIANGLGYTPLIQALRAKQFEAARLLISSGVQVDRPDSAGRTPLSWACEQGDEPTVKALLEAAANINLKDANGLTPLMWTSKANHVAIAKMLIQSGADVHATDAGDKTALDYANQAQLTEIAEVLQTTDAANVDLTKRATLNPTVKATYDAAHKEAKVARSQQTESHMRSISTALETYAMDHDAYPLGESGDLQILVQTLQPTYIKTLPLKDEWGNPFRYYCVNPKETFWLVSYGEDGKPEKGIYNANGVPSGTEQVATTTPDGDIILSNGSFIRYPRP